MSLTPQWRRLRTRIRTWMNPPRPVLVERWKWDHLFFIFRIRRATVPFAHQFSGLTAVPLVVWKFTLEDSERWSMGNLPPSRITRDWTFRHRRGTDSRIARKDRNDIKRDRRRVGQLRQTDPGDHPESNPRGCTDNVHACLHFCRSFGRYHPPLRGWD